MTTTATSNLRPASRPRVLLAIDGLGIGGAEMVVRDLARHADPRCVEILVCCTKELGSTGEALAKEGVDIFVLPGKPPGGTDYLTPWKLRREIVARGIDIVHTHSPSAFFDAALCRATLRGVKVMHTFHFGNYPHVPKGQLWMERLASRVVDRLIAVGRNQRTQLLTTYGLADEDIGMIWNGVSERTAADVTPFAARVDARGRLVIGTLAKLIPQKGLDDLMRVARRCRDLDLPVVFVIVGEGPGRADLERQRSQLGLEEDVVLTGWVDDAARTALPVFDVFFQPSRWEAMSIAVLEAMAAAKAIVATGVGDNPFVIDHERSGLIVDAGDIDGMTSALRLMVSPDTRTRFGTAARQAFVERFTLARMVRAYESIYVECATK